MRRSDISGFYFPLESWGLLLRCLGNRSKEKRSLNCRASRDFASSTLFVPMRSSATAARSRSPAASLSAGDDAAPRALRRSPEGRMHRMRKSRWSSMKRANDRFTESRLAGLSFFGTSRASANLRECLTYIHSARLTRCGMLAPPGVSLFVAYSLRNISSSILSVFYF